MQVKCELFQEKVTVGDHGLSRLCIELIEPEAKLEKTVIKFLGKLPYDTFEEVVKEDVDGDKSIRPMVERVVQRIIEDPDLYPTLFRESWFLKAVIKHYGKDPEDYFVEGMYLKARMVFQQKKGFKLIF